MDYCDQNAGLWDCSWFERAGLDLTTIDTARYEQSNKDDRVKVSIAVDPAMSSAYNPDSLGAIESPVFMINLGDPAEILPAVNASQISGQFNTAEYHAVAKSGHFSFLGECTRAGGILIAASGEDAICDDHADRTRADVHAELQGRIVGYLWNQFGKTN